MSRPALVLIITMSLQGAAANSTSAQDPSSATPQSPAATVLPRGHFPALSPSPRVAPRVVGDPLPSELAAQVESTAPSLSERAATLGPLVTVASSLAIVLALFAGLVWLTRRFGGGVAPSRALPSTALSPLGYVQLDPRTKVLLVRCGRRVLVLSQTASGLTPLSEITDAEEIRELVANCSAEARQAFDLALRNLEREPVRGGFTETLATQSQPVESRRLFATT